MSLLEVMMIVDNFNTYKNVDSRTGLKFADLYLSTDTKENSRLAAFIPALTGFSLLKMGLIC